GRIAHLFLCYPLLLAQPTAILSSLVPGHWEHRPFWLRAVFLGAQRIVADAGMGLQELTELLDRELPGCQGKRLGDARETDLLIRTPARLLGRRTHGKLAGLAKHGQGVFVTFRDIPAAQSGRQTGQLLVGLVETLALLPAAQEPDDGRMEARISLVCIGLQQPGRQRLALV